MAIEAASPEELEKYGMTMAPTQNVLGRVRATDNAVSARVRAPLSLSLSLSLSLALYRARALSLRYIYVNNIYI
jgi:hypothetical protein